MKVTTQDQRDNADAAKVPDYATVVRQRDEARDEVIRLGRLIDTFCDRMERMLQPRKPTGIIEDAMMRHEPVCHTLNPKGGGPCE